MTLGQKYPFMEYAWIHRTVVKIAQEMRQLLAPNSPNGTHYMVQIEPDIWRQIEGFASHEYFLSCFNGYFSIGPLKNHPGVWFMVHANDLPYFSAKPLMPVKVCRLK